MITITIDIPDELAETIEINCGTNAKAYFEEMIVKMLYRFKEQNEKDFIENLPKEEKATLVADIKKKNKQII